MVSSPRAITCKVMIPTSRLARSMSEMSPVHVQVNRWVGLRPSLAFPQRLDAFSQLTQENVSAAGHALILGIAG